MWPLHAIQPILEARVGTQIFQARIDIHVRQRRRSFLEGHIKPAKRLIPFSQAGVDEGYRVRHYVFVPAEFMELIENAKRLASLPRCGIGAPELGEEQGRAGSVDDSLPFANGLLMAALALKGIRKHPA